jgi:membrane protein YqaA with SNARE-associated domain
MVKQLKRLYDWVLRWADTTHAQLALFLIAFAESSFFPVPPDILLIAMVIAGRERWLRYFGICLLGSVLGGLVGYAIGWGAWQAVSGWFFKYVFSEATFQKVQSLYQEYDFWAVFVAGLTPIPYKVFTIAGGVAQINISTFIVASCLSRGLRFFLVAFLIKLFGPQIRTFIDRYFNWLMIVFCILLVGGFFAIKYFTH